MRPGPESTLNAAFELTPQAALLSWRTCLRRGPPVPGWKKPLGLAPSRAPSSGPSAEQTSRAASSGGRSPPLDPSHSAR
jgi:hypothetical protein